MDEVDVTLLTDDELAALAVHHGGAWPSDLPTVGESEQALLAAVLRGRRSLGVRGLLTADEAAGEVVVDADLAEMVEAAITGPVSLSYYSGQQDLSATPEGFLTVMYRGTDAERSLCETVTGDGVHSLSWMSRDQSRRALTALLAVAVDPVDGPVDGAALVVVVPGDPSTVVLADPKGIRVGHVERDLEGPPVLQDEFAVATPEDALARLGW